MAGVQHLHLPSEDQESEAEKRVIQLRKTHLAYFRRPQSFTQESLGAIFTATPKSVRIPIEQKNATRQWPQLSIPKYSWSLTSAFF